MDELDKYVEFGDQELRKKNIATVLKYVNSKGDQNLERWKLYTEDGIRRVAITTDDQIFKISKPGHASLKASDAYNHKYFPEYHYENNILFQTQDPNYFVVLSEGKGFIDFPAYGKRRYDNYFVHTFQMEDGKIKIYSELLNFCRQFHALGLEMPLMEFPE